MVQTVGELFTTLLALRANTQCLRRHFCSADANYGSSQTFRQLTLETLVFSRPVDEELTARNEPLWVLPGAKEGRLWPTT
jgi:hypothetical protein